MNDPRFIQGIEDIRKLSLSAEEKRRILAQITQTAPATDAAMPDDLKPDSRVRSPWPAYSFGAWVSRHSWVSAAALVLVVLIGTGTIASAAEGALPGDALYRFKIAVTEPLRGVLAQTPEAQASWEAAKATRRLEEAEILTSEGRLDEPAQQQLATLLDTHAEAFATAVSEVRSANSEARADDISVSFQADLNAHAKVLDALVSEPESSGDTQNSFMEAVAIASRARMHAESAEPVRLASARPAASMMLMKAGMPAEEEARKGFVPTASPMAMKLMTAPAEEEAAKNGISQKGAAKKGPAEKMAGVMSEAADAQPAEEMTVEDRIAYETKKEAVKPQIDAARLSVAALASTTSATSTDASSLKDTIIADAGGALEQAEQSLAQAEERAAAGDGEGAYSALLEAERAAREARTILRAGQAILHTDR